MKKIGLFMLVTFVGMPSAMIIAIGIFGGVASPAHACEPSVAGGEVIVQPNGVTLDTTGLTVKGVSITDEQAKNAATIIGGVSASKLPEPATTIALITAMVESTLVNLPYGDRDSVGLFQQRDHWGTLDERMDPVKSLNLFLFGGTSADGYSEPGLTDIDGWQSMPMGDAAQAVQVSAFPDRYAERIDEAEAIIAAATIDGEPKTPVYSEDDCTVQEELDPIEKMVQAALSRQGDPYDWNETPFTGAKFMSWAANEGGITLPSSIDVLSGFTGNAGQGVSGEWIPASDISSGKETLKRGDLVFGSNQPGAARSASDHVSLYVGDEDAVTGSFTIATYNILHSEHHSGPSNIVGGCQANPVPGDPVCAKTRTKMQTRIITGEGVQNPPFDVFGTQETSPTQYRLLKEALPGYDVFPTDASRMNNKDDGAVAIWWDSSQFSQFDSGKARGISNVSVEVTVPWVGLQTSLGQKFYVMSIHYPTATYGGTRETLLKGSRLTLDWVKSKVAVDAPVFVVGDFNDRLGERITYCAYTEEKLMQHAFDSSRDVPQSRCPSSSQNVGIDHVYATSTKDMLVSGWTHLRPAGVYGTASDHTPAYAGVRLPGVDPSLLNAKYGLSIDALKPEGAIQVRPVKVGSMTGVLRLSVDPGAATDKWVFPLEPGTYTFTHNTYGPRVHPVTGAPDFHNGSDFGTGGATPPVLAASSGQVIRAEYDSAWGNYVIIDHGKYLTLYAHLSRFSGVTDLYASLGVAGKVNAGDVIGAVGSTGFSTGEHLHFTVCTSLECVSGNEAGSVDPIAFLLEQGIRP